MMTRAHSLRTALACFTLILSALLMLPIAAQAQVVGPPTGGSSGQASPSLTGPTAPKAFQTYDALGVDLASGDITYNKPLLSIGAPGTLNLSATYLNFPGTDENTGAIDYSGDPATAVMSYRVSMGNSSEIFDSNFVATQGTGSTLAYDGGSNSYIYTKSDGTVATYDMSMANKLQIASNGGVLSSVTYPSGEKLNYYYKSYGTYVRLRSVVSNRGLMLKYSGQADTANTLTITAVNLAYQYCHVDADTCPVITPAWPRALLPQPVVVDSSSGGTSYHTVTRTVTDPADKVSSRVYNQTVISSGNQSQTIYSVQVKDEENRTTTYSYNDVWTNSMFSTFADGKIKSAVLGSTLSRGYGWLSSGPLPLPYLSSGSSAATGTDGDAFSMTFARVSQQKYHEVAPSARASMGNNTSYARDSYGRVTEITYPEGNKEFFTYDSRGNVTEQRIRAKPDTTTIPDIVLTAVFPACTPQTIKKCNKPTSTFDAKGNETNYTYDDNGLLLTRTDPAAESGGVRPQTRYTYEAKKARVLNSSNVPEDAATAIYVLTQVSACATLASCTGGNDERKITYTYNDNLYPATVTTSGNGLSVATTTTYDRMGNIVAVDGPRTDVDDVSYKTYDVMRRPLIEINADPDQAGSIKRVMVQHVYDNSGLEIRTETGTGVQTNGSDFSRVSYVENSYNNSGLKVRTASYLHGVATPVNVTDFSYDTSGRVVCQTVRMNMTSLPAITSDMCTLGGEGSFGPDRITKNYYNASSQLLKVDEALLTGAQRTYARYTYSPNELKTSEKDANNNLTTLQYDRFDRLNKVFYPMQDVGNGASSSSDFEEYRYDANSNRTYWKRRDNSVITDCFDNLNRVKIHYIHAQDGCPENVGDKDVYTKYDLQGRVLSKRFKNFTDTTWDITYTYDGLGRMASTTDVNNRLLSYQYNQAGARTRLTFPVTAPATSSRYIAYTLDALNRVNIAMVYGIGANATYVYAIAYDDLGNRRKLARINNVTASECGSSVDSTCYGYDGFGRLTSMTNDFNFPTSAPDDVNDVTWSFSYSPAGQLISLTNSGTDDFEYDQKTPETTPSEAHDGLNRVSTLVGNQGICTEGGYDGRQNLKCHNATGRKFTYDIENRLIKAIVPDGAGYGTLDLNYDPEGRIYKQTYTNPASVASVTTFLYDGVSLVGEYDANGLVAENYFGPRVDEPLVSYNGTTNWRLYWANYQGSIVGITSGGGTMIQPQLYKYTPYGEPKTWGNDDGWSILPRFGYTGQATLHPKVKLYHYKARSYDPALGRFLQTDPVGSEDNLNLYAYTAGDPVNSTDTSGTECNGWCEVYYPNGRPEISPSLDRTYNIGSATTPGIGHNGGPPLEPVAAAATPTVAAVAIAGAVTITTLASFAPHPDMVKLNEINKSLDNIIYEHLTTRDLEAARRESKFGEVVARKANGVPYDHVNEVREAQNGLIRNINRINQSLMNPNTSNGFRSGFEKALSRASKALDRSEGYLPRRPKGKF